MRMENRPIGLKFTVLRSAAGDLCLQLLGWMNGALTGSHTEGRNAALQFVSLRCAF